ncbi:hypothetical protein B0T16DRAFT_394640 [Cercophora newfieldiana]|uniref:Uncharacterized protein n=1 Tax=Cercophora newfieldiana TaxID=92897 RepID=A0AA39XRB8_9PEZI|nr:hypothetical protein B0T16DRAFT_394640 [Cercophora newfieldiana]
MSTTSTARTNTTHPLGGDKPHEAASLPAPPTQRGHPSRPRLAVLVHMRKAPGLQGNQYFANELALCPACNSSAASTTPESLHSISNRAVERVIQQQRKMKFDVVVVVAQAHTLHTPVVSHPHPEISLARSGSQLARPLLPWRGAALPAWEPAGL